MLQTSRGGSPVMLADLDDLWLDPFKNNVKKETNDEEING